MSLVERVAPGLAAGSSVRFGSVKSDAAQVIGIYQRHAQAYLGDRDDRLIEQRWLDRFVALLPSQRRTVLDIGCGTGAPITRYLIEQGCQVHGVDSSGAMIAMCVDRFPEQQWDIADARTLDPRSHVRRNPCLGQHFPTCLRLINAWCSRASTARPRRVR